MALFVFGFWSPLQIWTCLIQLTLWNDVWPVCNTPQFWNMTLPKSYALVHYFGLLDVGKLYATAHGYRVTPFWNKHRYLPEKNLPEMWNRWVSFPCVSKPLVDKICYRLLARRGNRERQNADAPLLVAAGCHPKQLRMRPSMSRKMASSHLGTWYNGASQPLLGDK